MKTEKKHAAEKAFTPAGCLFDIVLLYLNSIGIAGALADILEIHWREIGKKSVLPGLEPVLFWGILLFFCVAAVLVRSGPSGKKVLIRAAVIGMLYIILGVIFRKALSEGLSLVLKNAVENLNERYEFHISWTAAKAGNRAGWNLRMRILAMTCSALYLLFPLELLAGVFGRYDRGFCLIVGNALWFTLACVCDRFPGFFFLAFCVAGAVATLVQKDFRKRPGMGFAVAACAAMLAGFAMAAVFRFFLPVMDQQYEELQERRGDFYRLVNEEWIPKVKSILPGGGFGQGVDVTGELGRNRLFAYTAEDAYRVTVNQKPQGTMYLKGFVGGTYDEKEWLAQSDRELEDYYKSHGMELPETFGAFANIGYEAAKKLQHGAAPVYIRMEELGGRGSYSIYPYGALLTEEFQVHGDGSVARKSSEYGFRYYFLSGFGGRNELPAGLAETEQHYRQYVYDRFLEYPEEELPRLTACLEGADIRTDNIYSCTLDLIHLLDRQADYNLDAENNPSGTDFVEYFLFDSREGYCVHFASAAVLALRYFGIPARYVAGYTVSPSDFTAGAAGTYTAVITGKQAHAWAEVYLDTIGWVPVEMTPGAVAFPEDNRMEQLGQLGQLAGQGLMLAGNEELWQQDKMTWQNDALESNADFAPEAPGSDQALLQVMDTEGGGQPEMKRGEGQREGIPGNVPGTGDGIQQTPAEREKSIPLTQRAEFRFFVFVLAFAMLLAAFVCLVKWDENRRREIFCRADRRERIFLLYRNFRSVFQLAGIGRELDVDGEEFRQVLQDSFRINDAEYENFRYILEKSSFAMEEPSEEELRQVYSMYGRLTGEVYRRAAFYKKPLIRRYQSQLSVQCP